MKIRKLTTNDVELFRSIRLEALKLSQENFGSSYADESQKENSHFENWINDGFIMGAFDEDQLVATVEFFQNKGEFRKHIGRIWGVYTKPDYRRKGLSKKLLHEIYNTMPSDIEILELGVRVTNDCAHTLYKKEGFEQYGLSKKATKMNGAYNDEILMAKYL